MTILNDEIVKDLNLAREVISNEDCSVVVVKYGKIWKKIKGEGVKPMLTAIEEMGEDIYESVIGDKILGKASSLPCRYAKANRPHTIGSGQKSNVFGTALFCFGRPGGTV